MASCHVIGIGVSFAFCGIEGVIGRCSSLWNRLNGTYGRRQRICMSSSTSFWSRRWQWSSPLLFLFFAFFAFLLFAQEIILNFDHALHLFPQSLNVCKCSSLLIEQWTENRRKVQVAVEFLQFSVQHNQICLRCVSHIFYVDGVFTHLHLRGSRSVRKHIHFQNPVLISKRPNRRCRKCKEVSLYSRLCIACERMCRRVGRIVTLELLHEVHGVFYVSIFLI